MAPEQTVTFPESAEWPVPDQLAGEERHTPASREGAGPGHPVRVAGVGGGSRPQLCSAASRLPASPKPFPARALGAGDQLAGRGRARDKRAKGGQQGRAVPGARRRP